MDGFTLRNGWGYNDPDWDHFSGGGIFCSDSSPTIRDCILTGNEAYKGGGVYLSSYSSAVIENCTIIDNIGRGYGGGIRCRESTPTIRNCTITGNSTEEEGGGINLHISDAEISNCTITGNSAGEVGGGILLWSCNPTIQDCTITDNFAGWYGGGIKGYATSPLISNCEIIGNSAVRSGGGLFFYNCISPSIENCTISKNYVLGDHVPNYGGGIWIDATAGGFLTNCTISENYAPDNGGGVAMENASMTVSNCAITGNLAGQSGGGMSCYGTFDIPVIKNCTLSGNIAGASAGGILCNRLYTLTITNSILWGDSAPEGPEISVVWESALDISYSDVQGGAEAAFIEPGAVLNWQEGNINADPLFVGGEDFHLRTGSPCIDSGIDTGIYTDIDSDVRPFGSGFDMGADEYNGEHWALELDVSYEEGFLNLDMILGTLEPALWATYLIISFPTVQVVPIWSFPLPAIDPPIEIPISLPFPSMGLVGVWTGLITEEGVQADVFDWVYTG